MVETGVSSHCRCTEKSPIVFSWLTSFFFWHLLVWGNFEFYRASFIHKNDMISLRHDKKKGLIHIWVFLSEYCLNKTQLVWSEHGFQCSCLRFFSFFFFLKFLALDNLISCWTVTCFKQKRKKCLSLKTTGEFQIHQFFMYLTVLVEIYTEISSKLYNIERVEREKDPSVFMLRASINCPEFI